MYDLGGGRWSTRYCNISVLKFLILNFLKKYCVYMEQTRVSTFLILI